MPRITILGILLTVGLFFILIVLNYTVNNNYVTLTDPSISLKNPKDIRCKNFLTQADAQKFFLSHTGLESLDKDSDGVVCESLPK